MSKRVVTGSVRVSAIAAALLMTAASAAPARENSVVLMPGTRITVVLGQTIATATARAGDHIDGELARDITMNGRIVVPKGSRVEGRVVAATPSGTLSQPAALDFTLTELTPPGGLSIPIATSHYSRKGETHTKHEVEYIAGGAAVGALIGQLAGRDTKSTLTGTAAGAVAGTAAAAATGRLDFQVEAGRTVGFTLRKATRVPVFMQ